MLPVMIFTLFLMLQQQDIGWLVKFGTPIAIMLAAGWTALQMARTPAFVSFRNDRVLVQTFLEATTQFRAKKWHFVIDVQTVGHAGSPSAIKITYGHTSFEFKSSDWKHFGLLANQLDAAKKQYENKVRASIT